MLNDISDKIKNLFKTAKDVVEVYVNMGQIRSQNAEKRMETCLNCECFDGKFCSSEKCNGQDGKAPGCGCFMAFKTQLEASTCPRKKW